MPVTNATFVIDRKLSTTASQVFAAYKTLEAKKAWFKTPTEAEVLERHLDFREGGVERFHARWPSGLITDFRATYHDIVENERIVLVYDLFHADVKLSVSLQVIEMRDDEGGTVLTHTEHGAYFSGGLEAMQAREHGTGWHVDNLVALMEGRQPRAWS